MYETACSLGFTTSLSQLLPGQSGNTKRALVEQFQSIVNLSALYISRPLPRSTNTLARALPASLATLARLCCVRSAGVCTYCGLYLRPSGRRKPGTSFSSGHAKWRCGREDILLLMRSAIYNGGANRPHKSRELNSKCNQDPDSRNKDKLIFKSAVLTGGLYTPVCLRMLTLAVNVRLMSVAVTDL